MILCASGKSGTAMALGIVLLWLRSRVEVSKAWDASGSDAGRTQKTEPKIDTTNETDEGDRWQRRWGQRSRWNKDDSRRAATSGKKK